MRTGCVAAEIIVDDRGRARGVRYFDAEGQPQEQPADIVIVSASATETARLLLNSKSKLFPNGAGNNNDWVGRNLQGHGYVGAWGLMPEETYEEAGPGATVAICDFSHGNAGLVGGGMLANEFIRLPYLFAGVRPPGEPRWGKAHKDFQRRYYKRCLRLVGPIQEMPNFSARVSVDPTVKDELGNPRLPPLGLAACLRPATGRVSRRKRPRPSSRKLGASSVWRSGLGLGLSGGQHQAGTCRMGNDPKTSVTNRFGQVHQIDNLFVADASLHVTNGGFNPVLTIMALAYWVSHHIKAGWKASKFQIMKRLLIFMLKLVLLAGLFLVAAGVGGMAYFHFGDPRNTCASCHEMTAVHSAWSNSAHASVHCRNCHGGSLTLDVHALRSHVNRVVQHFSGNADKPIRLTEKDILALHDACRSCHARTFADWKASRHSATYAGIFLDSDHNKTEQLAPDCLRCHGMFYDGHIEDLVATAGRQRAVGAER